jgi:hypothetical protein
MPFFRKLGYYLQEQIVRLIFYHVLFIFFAAGLILYTRYHAEHYHERPALEKIANQESKRKLAQIIVRELYGIESRYQVMLLFENVNRIKLMAAEIEQSSSKIADALEILNHGGALTDIMLVNFYDKDEIRETINFEATDSQNLQIEIVNLKPKLADLGRAMTYIGELLLTQNRENPSQPFSENFQLTLAIKKTEALLLRTRESANKIFYDIKLANQASQKMIDQNRIKVKHYVLATNIVSNLLVVFLAALITLKIFKILKTQEEIQARNNWLATTGSQRLWIKALHQS